VGASGKAILAYLDEGRRNAILDQVTNKTRRAELVRALDTVRSQGFATSQGEVIVGAIALAAPTFNHNGEVTGCIGLFGPKARVKDSDIPRFGTLVIKAANAISLQFGYRTGPNAGGKLGKSRRERGVA
jgi:DNA-binding IclR family transcriptional regulator